MTKTPFLLTAVIAPQLSRTNNTIFWLVSTPLAPPSLPPQWTNIIIYRRKATKKDKDNINESPKGVSDKRSPHSHRISPSRVDIIRSLRFVLTFRTAAAGAVSAAAVCTAVVGDPVRVGDPARYGHQDLIAK